MKRCKWCGEDALYVSYHDQEWGVPVRDDAKMFEFLLLETFQAGLSWITILRKREHFRSAFADFNPTKIAQFTETDIERLMGDAGIIRNRQKIVAAINNAQKVIEMKAAGLGLADYFWSFTSGAVVNNQVGEHSAVQATSPLSDAISKDLKKRGFKFVGSTTIYAHLQAAGLVNDHLTDCFRHAEVSQL